MTHNHNLYLEEYTMLRDNSVNFIAYVNNMDISDIDNSHVSMGVEYEINDGFVVAVLFRTKEEK